MSDDKGKSEIGMQWFVYALNPKLGKRDIGMQWFVYARVGDIDTVVRTRVKRQPTIGPSFPPSPLVL